MDFNGGHSSGPVRLSYCESPYAGPVEIVDFYPPEKAYADTLDSTNRKA